MEEGSIGLRRVPNTVDTKCRKMIAISIPEEMLERWVQELTKLSSLGL